MRNGENPITVVMAMASVLIIVAIGYAIEAVFGRTGLFVALFLALAAVAILIWKIED
jgi:hypothetical protein